jgi:hypothetical protein
MAGWAYCRRTMWLRDSVVQSQKTAQPSTAQPCPGSRADKKKASLIDLSHTVIGRRLGYYTFVFFISST